MYKQGDEDLEETCQEENKKAGKQDWSQKAEVFALLRSPESVCGERCNNC